MQAETLNSLGNSYGVDIFHVPVPEGDCSIHLLIRSKEMGQGPAVVKAILVDGDRSAEDAFKAINETVRQIQKTYESFKGFDVWVVTHWDEDHYIGGLEWFHQGNRNRTATLCCPVHPKNQTEVSEDEKKGVLGIKDSKVSGNIN